MVAGDTFDLNRDELAKYRPAYRFLAYAQASAGQTPRDDLYGDDQPEQLARLYEELFGWLGLPVPKGN
ncbi:hypothetical protein [Subtercola lobariae]|uniref:Uncharacterized protein n=1 Tax=Subtercola lobariae TaxID=1588641 RepID=A0A917EUE5_9MICO|nr:hypothetical protein [Subtercola lobariae]GGF17592.1 hypothetical protein GCM10011399_09180 [Subtercola lobariae]